MKTIHIVSLAGPEGAIGRNNDLVVHHPRDMSHFRKSTQGHVILMGYSTYRSIADKTGREVLPNRINAVVCSDTRDLPPSVLRYSSLEEALRTLRRVFPDRLLFVIGGQRMYEESLSQVDEVWATHFDVEVHDADRFYPAHLLQGEDWIVDQEEEWSEGVRYVVYKRRT